MATIEALTGTGLLRNCGLNRQGCQEYDRQKDGSRMILVPRGSFLMGSKEKDARDSALNVPWYNAPAAECPQLRLHLDAFLIDCCEVTNAQFARFLNDVKARPQRDEQQNGKLAAVGENDAVLCYDAVDYVEKRGIPNSKHDQGVGFFGERWEPTEGAEECPVVLVTWTGASEYARWVNCCLPTEAQWEKAARGTDGRQFPWGDRYFPDAANTADRWLGRVIPDQSIWDQLFCQNSLGEAWLASRPLPVSSFPDGVSPYGCQDMIGNVAEWCSTWYVEDAYLLYGADGVDYSERLTPTAFRVMRGAGRYGYAALSRCACRRRREPRSVSENLGFRCALMVEP